MVVVVPQIPEQKPCRDGSFIRLSSIKIAELCYQTLSNIEEYKRQDLARLIVSLKNELLERREKKRHSLWSKIFGYVEPPMPSDRDLIRTYEQSGDGVWMPETTFIEIRYMKHIEVANRLLNAAKYVDEIAISTEDLKRLI